MHNLIHLADDVRNMECNLSYLTCFPFENMLGRLKKQMRSGTHVLAQAARHLFVKHFLDTKRPGVPAIIEIVKEKIQSNQCIIQEMRFETFTLKPSYPPIKQSWARLALNLIKNHGRSCSSLA